MSQLKKGAILSYGSILLTIMVGLVLTPFMVRTLGDSEFGLYTLIGSIVGYIGLLDFGLNNTIIRFVARYRAQKDLKGEQNFLATTMLIYCFISVLVVIGGMFIYYNLADFFDKLTPSQIAKAEVMFLILVFNLAIGLPGNAFAAICSGYEHFVFPRMLNIVKYIVRSLMIVALLMLGGDAVGMVIVDTAVNIVVILINCYYVLRKLKVKFKFGVYNLALVKEIFSYSIWVFVFAIFSLLQWRAGQGVLGKISGAEAVTVFALGALLGSYYGTFSSVISGVFLPRAAKMTVLEASAGELSDMMIRIGRFTAFILMLIFGGFLLFGRQFVDLWIGNSYDDVWLIALIIMISYTTPLIQSFANAILEARRMFAFKAMAYIGLVFIGIGVGAYLVRFYGPVGIIIGTSGGWMLGQIIMNFYYYKKLKLQIPRFFLEVFKGLVPTFITVLAIGVAITYIPGAGWFNLGLKIALFAGVYILFMFKFGLNQYEIDVFKGTIPFLKKKNA